MFEIKGSVSVSTIEPHIHKHKESNQINEFYTLIFNNSIDIIYLIEVTDDARFIHLDINTAYTKATGLPREAIVGRFVEEIDNEAFRNILIDKYAYCLNVGEKTDYIGEYDFPSGHKFFHSTLSPIRDEFGRIHRIVGIARDITEQKREEEKLKKTKAKLSALIATIPDLLWVKDTKGKYLTCNSHFERFFGAPASEIIGKTDYDFITTEEADLCIQTDKLAIEAGTICITQETITYQEDGKTGILEIRKLPVYSDTEFMGVLGIGRDITERLRDEERLRQSEEAYRKLAENYPDVIIRYDRECRRTYVNSSLIKISGYSEEELLGKQPIEYASLIAPQYFMAELKKVMDTEVPSEHEVAVYRPNGEIGWYMASFVPEFDGGSVCGVLCVAHDITHAKRYELILQKSADLEKTLSRMVANLPGFVYTSYMTPEGNSGFRYASSGITTLFGLLPESVTKDLSPLYAVIHADDIALLKKAIEFSAFNMSPLEIVFRVKIYEKEKRWIEARAFPQIEADGSGIILWHGVMLDVTERMQLAAKLNKKEARLNEAQQIAKLGSWELKFSDQTLIWSDEIYRIFEITPTEQPPSYDEFINAVHPEDRGVVDTAFTESLANKTPYEIIHRIRMKDGRIKYVHEKGKTYYDSQGYPLRTIGTVQDITKQKSIEKKIEFMAHHDALTGLPNRILAQERTEQIMANAKRTGSKAALLFIDLDGFKTINDSLGHSVGDTILKNVTSRLIECIRKSDILSRQGGDEFLLVVSDIDTLEDIRTLADKLLIEMEKPFMLGNQSLCLSGSIGISIYPEHGETFETLLQCSDTAMYRAKETGKNSYCFYTQQMNHNLIGLFKMQNDLRSALENNEFVLHYQPQIDLASNRITGAEALIRWEHPHLGMIPPMNFIPIAESSGLIVSIGQWVIEEACRQIALWHAKGIAITVAVNISSVQFKRGNLESVVENALREYKIDPQCLELELTESIIMHDTDNTLQSVRNLKALGVQLSIDDFGTGYSSLAYLKRFAVDKLKIDQSFVRDILQDQEDAIIVRTIVQMAKSLNLKTIAEGVENHEVLALIEGYGCDEVQGYHFAKPMRAVEFETYFNGRLEE